MRIVCISDTHALERDIAVPDGDVLIHAGDLTKTGRLSDVLSFNEWLGTLPHHEKLVIAGNHDFCFEPEELRDGEIRAGRQAARRAGTGLMKGEQASSSLTNATYLCDSGVEIAGKKFWGSPWQPWFYAWAFNLHPGPDLERVWMHIPNDVNILITHGPPGDILDQTVHGARVGCEQLRARIRELPELKLHVFGHIHEAYGTQEVDGVIFANASVCSADYRPKNDPLCFDL